MWEIFTKHLDIGAKSDEELLAMSVHYPPAFERLLAKYQDAFLRKVRPIVGGHEAAEEVVQEAFTKIYLYAGKFEKREGAQFSSWGYKILLNTAFTRYQKEKRAQTVELTPELANQLSEYATDDMREIEIVDEVVGVLARLPDQVAGLLRRYFLEGKSQQQIAVEDGVALGTVKTRLHRAKQSFRDVSIKMI